MARPIVAGALGLTLAIACGEPSRSGSASSADPASLARSVCPGSVPRVLTNLSGARADAVEQLQGRYGEKPGFLAVVFDGTQAIVVVESGQLAEWRAGLAPSGVSVAPSCIDVELLRGIHAAVPAMSNGAGIVSGGYDGLADRIDVDGVAPETLFRALDALGPGGADAAREAIANGTLHLDPGPLLPIGS